MSLDIYLKALRLADALELDPMPLGWYNDAAAELRRLHTENERLREAARMALEALDIACLNYGEVGSIGTHWGDWDTAAPQQRKPLTEEEIESIWRQKPRWHAPPIGTTDIEFARAVERAHGIGGEE